MGDRSQLVAIGLGPGDPELLTIKGLRAIQSADVIFVPRSRGGAQSLALRIAEPWIDRSRQQVMELPLPMTRDADQLRPAWRDAAETIITALADVRHGVYLLLGDPLLYGTFTYLWRELAAHPDPLPVTIIPGVTSFAAAAAAGGVPLGTTDDRLIILPASYETDADRLQSLLADFATIVLMKAGPVLPQIVQALEELGILEHAFYAERVGMPEELIVRDLHTMDRQRRPYLSLVIIRRGGNL
jgi:precorrin-2/cobalt-factor-2 C20-methyltransferase